MKILDTLDRLREAATPAPWKLYSPGDGGKPRTFIARHAGQFDDERPSFYVAAPMESAQKMENGFYIVAACNAEEAMVRGIRILERIVQSQDVAHDIDSGEVMEHVKIVDAATIDDAEAALDALRSLGDDE